MKKFTTLFIIAIIGFSFISQSQVKKGSIFLGGDIGGSTQKTKRDGTSIYSQNGLFVSPVFGKAIKENLILGADAGFDLYKNKYNNQGSNTDQKNNSYDAGIFIRKYKPLGKSGFSMFLQGRLGITYNSNEYNPFPNFDKAKRYTVGVSTYPGISYTISKRLQLETGFNNLLGLSYFTEKREVSNGSFYTERSNGISVSSSLNNLSSLYIGFRVLINK